MEGSGKPGGRSSSFSSSSFTSELFGSKGSSSSSSSFSSSSSSSSSSGIFDSVFSTPATILGKESSRSSMISSWNIKQESSGSYKQNNKGENGNSMYQHEKVDPCYLSSSLYYGGQDLYSNPSTTQNYESSHTYKKDNDEDDPNGNNSNSASRGNWWQGSLYY